MKNKILNKIKITTLLTLGLFMLLTPRSFAQDGGIDLTLPTDEKEVRIRSDSKDFSATGGTEFSIETGYSGGLTGIGQRATSFFDSIRNIFTDTPEAEIKLTVKDSEDKILQQETHNINSIDTFEVNDNNFTPGTYTLTAEIVDSPTSIEQNFTWGVLAINTNKSVYNPGDTADIALAVLDEEGQMACDSNITLNITDPVGQTQTFKSGDGTIRVSEQCSVKAFITEPDFSTQYKTSGEGTYKINLTATNDNGTFSINGIFEVNSDSEFSIERMTNTRIYPFLNYPVVLKITPKNNFNGIFTDKAPKKAQVFYLNNESIKKYTMDYDIEKGVAETLSAPIDDKYKTLRWKVNWKGGVTYYLAYEYEPVPESPDFYLFGKVAAYENESLTKLIYEDKRFWQVAVDAITYENAGSGYGGNSTTCDITSFSVTSADIIIVQVGTLNGNTVSSISDGGTTYQTANAAYGSGPAVEQWYGLSPSPGSKTITVTIGSNDYVSCGAISMYGVNQSTPIDTDSMNGGTGSGTNATASITTDQNDSYVLTVAASDNNDTISAGDASQDLRWNQANNTAGNKSNAGGTTEEIATSGSPDTQDIALGGNNTWAISTMEVNAAPVTDSWTGTVYTDEGTTVDSSQSTSVCGRVNNSTEACDTTDASGEFVIDTIDASASDQLTFFIDGGVPGNTVTVSDGNEIASGDNLKIYRNTVMVRDEQGSGISISDMANYDRDQNSADIYFTANTSLSIESGIKFYVYSDGTNNSTFDPGNTVTTSGSTGDMIVANSGTAYLDTATNTIAGDLVASASATLNIDAATTASSNINVAGSGEIVIASGQALTHNGSTLTLDGTISGSGTFYYTSSTAFPDSGTMSANLRIDSTNGNRNITDRSGGYGAGLEIYSNSAAGRTFTLGTGSSQTINVTGNLTLNAANTGAVTLTGATYNPTLNVSGNLDSTNGGGTENITTGEGTWTVTGDVDLTDVGTFTATPGNVFQMDGTGATLTSAGESFWTFISSGGSPSTADTMTVNGNFATSGTSSFTHSVGDMNVAGTFSASDSATFVHDTGSNIDIYIAGDFTLANGTTWTQNTDSSSQVTFNGDLDYKDENGTKQSIGNVVIGASPATTNLTTDYSSNSVTVIAGDYFNTCGYDMDIGNGGITLNTGSPGGTLDTSASGAAGSQNPCSAGDSGDETIINDANLLEIQSGAVFEQDQSTVIFDDTDGTNQITSNGESFYNVTIDDANDDASLIIQLADALDVDNNLSITDGQLDANAGGPYQINVGGNWDIDDGGGSSSFSAQGGLVIFDAASGNKTIDADSSGTDSFYDIRFSDGGSGPTYQLTTSLDVNNDSDITSGAELDANGQAISVQGSWDNTGGGTFTANGNTVTFDDQDGGETLTGTMTGSSVFYDIEFNDNGNSGAWSFGNNSAAVTHDFLITGGTVTAPGSGYTLTISEDFTDNDSGFTHNSGEVEFNGTANSEIRYTGNTTFFDLTISAAGKQVFFDEAQTTIITDNGSLTIQGTDCSNLIYLDSYIDDNPWDLNVSTTGTEIDIDYADIEDSNSTNPISAENSTEVNEGNTNWSITENTCSASARKPRMFNGTRGMGGVRIK